MTEEQTRKVELIADLARKVLRDVGEVTGAVTNIIAFAPKGELNILAFAQLDRAADAVHYQAAQIKVLFDQLTRPERADGDTD